MKFKKIIPAVFLVVSSFSQWSHAGNIYQKDWAKSDKFISVKSDNNKMTFQVCRIDVKPTSCETLGNPEGYSVQEITKMQKKLSLQGAGLATAYGAIVFVGALAGGVAAGMAFTAVVAQMSVASFFGVFGAMAIGSGGGIMAAKTFVDRNLNPSKKWSMASSLDNKKVDVYVASIDDYLVNLESALSLIDQNQSETLSAPISLMMP